MYSSLTRQPSPPAELDCFYSRHKAASKPIPLTHPPHFVYILYQQLVKGKVVGSEDREREGKGGREGGMITNSLAYGA